LIDNNNKIVGYGREIISISDEELKYNNIIETDKFELTTPQKKSLNNIKIINNELYEIYNDKI
jgi:hypothetical protein